MKAKKIQVSMSAGLHKTLQDFGEEHGILMDATIVTTVLVKTLRLHSSEKMRALKAKIGGNTQGHIDTAMHALFEKNGIK